MWSHSLGSGRMSKVFLENTDVNSSKYSGIKGDSALELALKASASRWEMVEDALISAEEGRGNRPVAKMWSLSSRDSGGTFELSWSEELEELKLWSISGMGPAVQMFFCWLSAFWATRCWQTLSLHPGQHQGGHLDILTSPVIQLISGLCFRSQEYPKINFCLPKPETAKVVLSEWFLQQRIKLTTSVIEPALLRVPSTLYTGIGRESLTRLGWLLLV